MALARPVSPGATALARPAALRAAAPYAPAALRAVAPARLGVLAYGFPVPMSHRCVIADQAPLPAGLQWTGRCMLRLRALAYGFPVPVFHRRVTAGETRILDTCLICATEALVLGMRLRQPREPAQKDAPICHPEPKAKDDKSGI